MSLSTCNLFPVVPVTKPFLSPWLVLLPPDAVRSPSPFTQGIIPALFWALALCPRLLHP